MRNLSMTLLLFFCVVTGCSSASELVSPANPVKESFSTPGSNKITWGHWIFHVSADHKSIEVVPMRQAEWHFNITKMVEVAPCSDCLQIGVPEPQPDGTLKVKVMLRHPFPNLPEFTGFDVRGVVMFPATRHWYAGSEMMLTINPSILPWVYEDDVPMFFSLAGDGGGALLNADGYSYYFWPGLEYWLKEGYEPGFDLNAPRFNYQQGRYATDVFPDSNINPYLEFNDGGLRRMFRVTDMVQREYHLQIPDGEFIFGYVVQASWWPPTVKPVIHPYTDFPPEANAEDPYLIEYTQFAPLDPYKPVPDWANTFAYFKFQLHSDSQTTHGAMPLIFCPDVIPWKPTQIVAMGVNQDEVYPRVLEGNLICALGAPDIDPYIDGIYPAVLVIGAYYKEYGKPPQALLGNPFTFELIELEVQSNGPEG